MSAVDVLDRLLAFAARGVERDDPARETIEAAHKALAAVAELIDAGMDFAVDDSLDAQRRFKTALSRVKGVQS